MLALREIDAVNVCTPNYLHCPMTVDALKAGKHVLCEKPMALNTAEAKRMVAAARKAKRLLMMAFCWRFSAQGQAAKTLIDAGEVGQVYHVRVEYIRRRGIPGLGGWFTKKKEAGGGPMLDVGVHFLDLGMWLAGFPEPRTVTAASHRIFGHRKDYTYLGMWGTTPVPGGPFEVEDLLGGFVRFRNGMSLRVEAAWACNSEARGFLEILGDKGGLHILPELEFYGQKNGQLLDVKPQLPKRDLYVAEMEHFADCIRRGKQPMPAGEHGVKVQQIIDALYRSARLGREVEV
jgi:predicted dehydrogenase